MGAFGLRRRLRHRSRPKPVVRSLETGRGTGSGIGHAILLQMAPYRARRAPGDRRRRVERRSVEPGSRVRVTAGRTREQPADAPANVNVSIRVLSPGTTAPSPREHAPATALGDSRRPSRRRSGRSVVGLGVDLHVVWHDHGDPTSSRPGLTGEGTGLDWVWNWLWTRDCARRRSLVPDQGGKWRR